MANGDNLIIGRNNKSSGRTIIELTAVGERQSIMDLLGDGEYGLAVASPGRAVSGRATTQDGIGVNGEVATLLGQTVPGIGVSGWAGEGVGVQGRSVDGFGVVGGSQLNAGVYGYSDQWTGVVGSTGNPSNYAGFFWGHVGITGHLTVWGGKSAAVPFPDGSHRLLYAMESPENWFEDFGTSRLVRGRARVKLDRDFAKVVSLSDYHVFISPEGDSRGLYVCKKTKGGFEVREQQSGKGSVRFSYRIVAPRKDFTAKRFARAVLPKRPKMPKLPAAPAPLKGQRKTSTASAGNRRRSS